MSRVRKQLGIALLVASTLTAPALAEPRSDAYRAGQQALESEEWDKASRIFEKLAAGSSDEADAALYWKAYADWEQKLKKDALAGVRKLLSTYPKSAWADDAKALELEIRGGERADGEPDAKDEELKLYALDGLMQMEPEKAVPILEKLLVGNATPRIKERALFVLSQSSSPKAREILLRTAKTGQPIALRCEAVKTLGIAGDADNIAALGEIARDKAAPREVREAVVEAYLIANRTDELADIARSDPNSRIRLKAIEALGANGALPTLRQLWSTEKDPAIRAKLLESFGVAGDVDTLAKAARESSDPQLRRKAIEGLAISNGPEARKVLRQLYGEFSAPEDKRRVCEAFMIQGDAKTLIELFRAEKDPAMKKVIVQQLSVMSGPEADQLILEILGAKP